jgi:hypothetical protein
MSAEVRWCVLLTAAAGAGLLASLAGAGAKPLSVGIPRRNLQLREGIGSSGNAWRPAHAAQRRLNALGGTRSLLSKPSNGTPRPVRGVLLFYSTVHPPYGVPWSAGLIRGPGGRLWLRRTAPQPNPRREANQLAASWRPFGLSGPAALTFRSKQNQLVSIGWLDCACREPQDALRTSSAQQH